MCDPNRFEPAWFKALTLAERVALDAPPEDIDSSRGARRLQRWREQKHFCALGLFEQRLADARLDEQGLSALLGERAEGLRKRVRNAPEWMDALTSVLASEASTPTDDAHAAVAQHAWRDFLPLVERFIAPQRAVLACAIDELSAVRRLCDANAIGRMLSAKLPGLLLDRVSRTLALELHVARVQNRLEGATPEERFQSFARELSGAVRQEALFAEYPVLARVLVETTRAWCEASVELATRLNADWDDLVAVFDLARDCRLASIDAGVGDTHCGGRAVAILHFDSGQKIVYKPRTLAVDLHFQALLAWCNAHGQCPELRTWKIVAREAYGWVEFVSAAGCASPSQLDRFFERQGALLALLYVVSATDFHNENLIAHGEHPALIDYEALFHPTLDVHPYSQTYALGAKLIRESVMSVGLLPVRFTYGERGESFEMSGLSGEAGQALPNRVKYWSGAGADRVALERKPAVSVGAANRPTLDGVEVNALEYRESIVAGFTAAYQLLLEHRSELLHGPLRSFVHDPVRVILRGTARYGEILGESFHPDLLRDALDRDRHFDVLWQEANLVVGLERVVHAEQQDLWAGDLPLFTARVGGRDLWTARGERAVDFIAEPVFKKVEHRVQNLCAEDLERQVRFIRASLASLSVDGDAPGRVSYALAELRPETSRADLQPRLLAAACSIGRRLDELALRQGDMACWVGMTTLGDGRWSLLPLGLDLYEGAPGVALFLAALARTTGDAEFNKLAYAAATALHGQIDERARDLRTIGMFDGFGGLIFTYTQLGCLLRDEEFFFRAARLIEQLPGRISADKNLDVIAGAAGCMAALVCLERCYPRGAAKDAAVLCAEHLLERVQTFGDCSAWLSVYSDEPLCGMSHGASGFAVALYRLHELTGEKRYLAAALSSLRYERACFSRQASNWPDFRKGAAHQPQPVFMTAWCHGAPGVGLARLAMLGRGADHELLEDVDAAVRATIAQGFGRNYCLCHGDVGNLEFLSEAARMRCDVTLRRHVDLMIDALLRSADRTGWLSGIPTGVETPGFMTGLAGTGYGLLRLANPGLPSVLSLCALDTTADTHSACSMLE